MSVAPYTRRIPKRFKKTVTFTGAAGLGLAGTVAVATVTGSVLLVYAGVRCTTLLVSAGGGTLELGCAGNTAMLIAQTTATDIDATDWWGDATPEIGISPAIVDSLVNLSLIYTVGTADVTGGVLEFIAYWLPFSDDGNMA